MINLSPSNIVARLDAVDWFAEDVECHARSRAKLMSEYLRRSALWAKHYNAADCWPFGDIVDAVAPGFELHRELELQVEEVLRRPGIGGLGAHMAKAAVRWAALTESRTELMPDLPPPYEPLILMFERGGSFFEEVFIDLSGSSLPRGTLEERARQPEFYFSTKKLDAIDIVCSQGKLYFYLLPAQRSLLSASTPLTRRIDIGADGSSLDSALGFDLDWKSTTALVEIEDLGGELESLSISEEEAIAFVEKML